MKKIIRKSDILLLIFFVAIGIVTALSVRSGEEEGKTVVIHVDGREYGTYSLADDREIDINRGKCTNHVSIKDGKVQMTEASCPNKLCIREGSISQVNRSIACLPNRVFIEIRGEEAMYDVVSQ